MHYNILIETLWKDDYTNYMVNNGYFLNESGWLVAYQSKQGGFWMRVTVMGAGNSGLAMAAHLSKEGNHVILWNRSGSTISKLVETHVIHCEGIFSGAVRIDRITDDIEPALDDPDIVLITTPANSHKELAELIANHIRKSTVIILNP